MRQELAHRRKLGYPPYSRLLRLELRDPDATTPRVRPRAWARNASAGLKSANTTPPN